MRYLLFTCLLCVALSVGAQTTPPVKARLNHTAIYVTSLQKSGWFYTTIIGLDTIPEPFHDGKHLWLATAPGVSLHIIEGAPVVKEYYKNTHTCFSVPSVEAFTEQLKKHHLTWEDASGKTGAITTRPDKVKQIWLQDPDGYWVEINDARN